MIMPTLTAAQKKVVRLMQEGWELHTGHYVRYGSFHYIRNSENTESEKVNAKLIDTLMTKRVIKRDEDSVCVSGYKYQLTERGRIVDASERPKE